MQISAIQNDKLSVILSRKNVDIYIFNRWGDSVYSITTSGINYANKSVQWNGKYSGKDLPLGTYVYILTVDGIEYNGTVTIVR